MSHLKLVALSNLGPSIYTLDCSNASQAETLIKEDGYPQYPRAEIAKFSPISGKTLAVVQPSSGIYLVDVESKKQILYIERKGVIAMEWSPKETYLITCEKFKTGTTENNLCLWDVKNGEMIAAY